MEATLFLSKRELFILTKIHFKRYPASLDRYHFYDWCLNEACGHEMGLFSQLPSHHIPSM